MRMHYAIEHERKIQPRFSIRNYKYRRQDDKKEPRQSELGTPASHIWSWRTSFFYSSIAWPRSLAPSFLFPDFSEIAFSKMQEGREGRISSYIFIGVWCIEMCNEDRIELFIYLSFRFIRNFFYRQVIRIVKMAVDSKRQCFCVTSFFLRCIEMYTRGRNGFQEEETRNFRSSGSSLND